MTGSSDGLDLAMCCGVDIRLRAVMCDSQDFAFLYDTGTERHLALRHPFPRGLNRHSHEVRISHSRVLSGPVKPRPRRHGIQTAGAFQLLEVASSELLDDRLLVGSGRRGHDAASTRERFLASLRLWPDPATYEALGPKTMTPNPFCSVKS